MILRQYSTPHGSTLLSCTRGEEISSVTVVIVNQKPPDLDT